MLRPIVKKKTIKCFESLRKTPYKIYGRVFLVLHDVFLEKFW